MDVCCRSDQNNFVYVENDGKYDIWLEEGVRIGSSYTKEECLDYDEDVLMVDSTSDNPEVDKVILGDIAERNKKVVLDILKRFEKVFITTTTDGNATLPIRHDIVLKDKTKIGRKIQYGRISQIEREEQKKFVKDLLDRNLVEEGDGSFIAPLILVKKKDGTKRIVVDYRQLNDNTVRDNYPIPRIDDTIDRLHGMKVFSTLDATDGFWQILMEEVAKRYTGFMVDGVHYWWKVMPMGLKNAPITFQRAMHMVLKELIGECCLVYMDDIIIYGKDEATHWANLATVLGRLSEYNIAIKPKKCRIGFSKTEYMGFIVGKDGVEMKQDRAEAIRGMKEPATKREIQRFLGMCNYYRKFIRNYSAKTYFMRQLLIDEKWRRNNAWDDDCQKEFDNLKEELCDTKIMAYPIC